MFSDKQYSFTEISISYKYVFKLWSKFICGVEQKCLTFADLKKIFPEFSHRLDMYENCCNKEGKVVKNIDKFKKYEKTKHRHGKRGGKNTIHKNAGKKNGIVVMQKPKAKEPEVDYKAAFSQAKQPQDAEMAEVKVTQVKIPVAKDLKIDDDDEFPGL